MKIEEILKKLNIGVDSEKDDLITARVSKDELAIISTQLVDDYKLPLSLLYGTDDRKEKNNFCVHVVFSLDNEQKWLMLSAEIPVNDMQYPSLTRTIMATHWYERYLRDMFGITPTGHPDLRRLVHHENIPENTHPLQKDFKWNTEDWKTEDIMKLGDKDDKGYTFEVDITLPVELHDHFNNYPSTLQVSFSSFFETSFRQ